jgi:hypothetical protein
MKNKNYDKFLDGIDLFGANVTKFNFEGRESVYSPIGVVCSLFTIVMTMVYTGNQAMQFILKQNTTIYVDTEDTPYVDK